MKNFAQDKFLNDILNSFLLKNISFCSDVNKSLGTLENGISIYM